MLTAANCQQDFRIGAFVVVGGTDPFGLSSSSQTFQVLEILPNPNFNSFTDQNDIMLVRIDDASTATQAILNFDGTVPSTGDLSTIVGFGNNDTSGVLPEILQEVNYHLSETFSSKTTTL